MHDFSKAQSLTLIGPLLQLAVKETAPIIYVDGGARYKTTEQGLSVGDGDSFDGDLDERLNPHKDYSDLAYVLASVPTHFRELFLYGFLGGRRDHEWVNLGEANAFLKHRHQATKIHFESEVTGFSAGKWQLSIHGTFSLLCLEPAKVMLSGACQYPLPQATSIVPLSSRGLSNVGEGDIVLQTDQPVFIVYEQTV